MHLKFATLHEKSALEAWIRNLEPLHGLKESVWLKDWRNSASHNFDSASLMKMSLDPTSWMNNSTCPMKIVVDSTSWMNNSASRLRFPQFLYVCVTVELQEGNSTSGLRVSIINRRNSTSHSGDSASGQVLQGTRRVAKGTRGVRVNMDCWPWLRTLTLTKGWLVGLWSTL